jgi:hypothetical protein
MYLQHPYNLSDEAVIEHRMDAPALQYFCEETCYQHDAPVIQPIWSNGASGMGKAGCEWL